jgi:hypothetical protein
MRILPIPFYLQHIFFILFELSIHFFLIFYYIRGKQLIKQLRLLENPIIKLTAKALNRLIMITQ